MRIACVLIPRFPLAVELLAHPELRGRPVVVGGAPDEPRTVVACSPEAEREGIHRGMQLRSARARSHEAVFIEAHPHTYRDLHERMLDALGEISPVVEGRTPGSAYVGLDGLSAGAAGVSDAVQQALYPTEAAVAVALGDGVQEAIGMRPRIGLAESRFASWAAATSARAGAVRAIKPGQAAAFLRLLPVRSLPLTPDTLLRLHQLGLTRVGDVADLPRGALAAQFGPEGLRAWDLAHGEGGEPLIPRQRLEVIREDYTFPNPVTGLPPIVAAIQHVLSRLLRRPVCAGRAVRGVGLSLALANGQQQRLSVTLHEPSSDHERLWLALAAKLDHTTFTAAVDALTITLRDLCAESGTQGKLFQARNRQASAFEAAIGQLRARFGEDVLLRIVPLEPWSRLPERRWGLIAYESSGSQRDAA